LVHFAPKSQGDDDVSVKQEEIYLMQPNLVDIKAPIKELIIDIAKKYGVDERLALKVANAESGFDMEVHNHTSTASGVYQFVDSTFYSQLKKYGMSSKDKNSYIQVELAMRMIANGGIGNWNASKSTWNK
jgi:hypothetical protein